MKFEVLVITVPEHTVTEMDPLDDCRANIKADKGRKTLGFCLRFHSEMEEIKPHRNGFLRQGKKK